MTRAPTILGLWAALLCAAPPAEAQVWIAPRRPGQSVVRNTVQDWHTIDLLVDADVDGQKAGGVRLFFYETERETAERAAAQIEAAYRELSRKFGFVPKKRFDYVLYATYQEFLKTNLFPLQEGVLGVTAVQGLHMAIPYFGSHETFFHTSTHELAHEFTLQLTRSSSKAAGVWRDPVGAMPLWFVEGTAEYMALGAIDGESAMRVRDLVVNPDLYTGHGMLGFWDDWPGYVLWTYQGGHARITFLEQTYGEGTVRRLIELSPAMVTDQGLAARIQRFDQLVEEVTGADREQIELAFDDWVKRTAFEEWLAADQGMAKVDLLDKVAGIPLAFDAAPDGNLIAYRSIAPDSGRTGLFVADRRRDGRTRRIAADGRPGVESLHPIDPRNFDVVADRIAYVAEARGRDRLVVQHLRHEATEEEGLPPEAEPQMGLTRETVDLDLPEPEPEDRTWWRVKLRKTGKDRVRLDEAGIVAGGAVAIDPEDPTRIALVGLHRDGTLDVYLVTGVGARDPEIRQLTDDVYAERDLAWGPDGLVFVSDATAEGQHHLFAFDPGVDAVPRRLTWADRDHFEPAVLADGTIVYAALEDDRTELYATYEGETVRLTDLPTGANAPATGPDGGLWSMVLYRGRSRPALLPSDALRVDTPATSPAAAGPPMALPTRDLAASAPYRPYALRNWGIDGGFAAIGAGPGGVFGQLFLSFSDKLRDHSLVIAGAAYGTPELTDIQAVYLSQAGRVTWGAGPFHALRFRVDRTLPDPPFLFQSGERFYGALGSVRYPLDRFVYVQTDLAVGGVSYFLTPYTEGLLQGTLFTPTTTFGGRDLVAEWRAANPDPRLQSEATLRFGVDTTRYHPKTGPVAGTSLLLESTGGVQPLDDQLFGDVRFDAQQYLPLPLIAGGNLGLRASAATSGGGPYATGYWLSSYDTLRAFTWGDPRLLGRHYWFANAELQVPLDVIVRLALASGIEGVAGLDFGGVSDDLEGLWDARVLDAALGTNFILGPLVLRLHFARAIDIGAPLPETRSPWVTNFSISWLGM